MGRIKTQLVKRLGTKLVKEHPDTFTTSFEENKKLVEQYLTGPSKKLRNIVAGYVTRLIKSAETA